jgi:hypothetical protein
MTHPPSPSVPQPTPQPGPGPGRDLIGPYPTPAPPSPPPVPIPIPPPLPRGIGEIEFRGCRCTEAVANTECADRVVAALLGALLAQELWFGGEPDV